jgi:hypothetical protein
MGWWSMPHPAAWPPRERPSTHCINYIWKSVFRELNFTNSQNWWICSQINCHSKWNVKRPPQSVALTFHLLTLYLILLPDYLFGSGWQEKRVNNELNMLWKEKLLSTLQYYPSICLGGLRDTTYNPVRMARGANDCVITVLNFERIKNFCHLAKLPGTTTP